jgi:hypothetical protein
MNSEGWTWIIGSPRWHYMINGMSLCGKWLLLGKPKLELGNDTSLDNCKSCRAKLEKKKIKAAP